MHTMTGRITSAEMPHNPDTSGITAQLVHYCAFFAQFNPERLLLVIPYDRIAAMVREAQRNPYSSVLFVKLIRSYQPDLSLTDAVSIYKRVKALGDDHA